jgi:hypothetical protein
VDLKICEADWTRIRQLLPQDGYPPPEDLRILVEMRTEARSVCPAFDEYFFPVFKAYLRGYPERPDKSVWPTENNWKTVGQTLSSGPKDAFPDSLSLPMARSPRRSIFTSCECSMAAAASTKPNGGSCKSSARH